MNTKVFVNFSKTLFTGRWDSVPYNIKPGQEVMLEDWKANHFAKHLVDRELQLLGKEVNDQSRDSLLAKCFVEQTDEEENEMSDLPEETQILNQERTKAKKAATKAAPKKVAKKADDEEFEGLEETEE